MVTVILNVRECDTCGHEAVALGGPGTECIECDSGVYMASSGFRDIQTSPATAEEYEENFGSEVINVSGNGA
jgi:hypothetical protein